MPKPPLVSGTEAVKALQRLGFQVDRQRGRHVVLKRLTTDGARGCVIPMHREIALGTLRAALNPNLYLEFHLPCLAQAKQEDGAVLPPAGGRTAANAGT